MDIYTTVVSFFQDGGPFMYPIAIVLGIGFAIALERYFYLMNQMRINRRDFDRILPLLKQRRQRELADVTRKSSSAMARIIAANPETRLSTSSAESPSYSLAQARFARSSTVTLVSNDRR